MPIKHLQKLAQEIGARPVGSRGNRKTADYIETVFKVAGLDVERQNYPCIDWEMSSAQLSGDGIPVDVTTNWYAPACDVTAPIIVIASLAELETADIQGRIALLCGELTQEMWTPKGFTIYTPPLQQSIQSLLEAKQPSALITVGSAFGKTEPIIKDSALAIPSVTVSPAVGLTLSGCKFAHLRIEAKQSQNTACNLVARKGQGSQKLVLCAHFDTVLGSVGAVDNATGISTLLALAEQCQDSPIPLEFIAFNGEELDARGDEVYLENLGLRLIPVMEGTAHTPILNSIRLVINIDSVAQRLGVNTMALFNLPDAVEANLKQLAQEQGFTVVEPWPMSNHYTFTSYGVPAIALSSTLIGNLTHGANDTLDWVDPMKLQETVTLIQKILKLWS